MIVKSIMIIISLAAIYHACTFAAWLNQNGNKFGAKSVYAIVVLALALLIV